MQTESCGVGAFLFFKNEKSMNRSSCLLNILKICYNRQDLTRAWRNDEDTGSLRYEAKKGEMGE